MHVYRRDICVKILTQNLRHYNRLLLFYFWQILFANESCALQLDNYRPKLNDGNQRRLAGAASARLMGFS